MSKLYSNSLVFSELSGKVSMENAIIERIRKLTTTINANIINTNNFQVYTLLTKFRVMSAISDDNFMQLLINDIGEDHTQALTEALQGAINMQKAIVNAAIKRCNDNIIKAGQLGATINTIEKECTNSNRYWHFFIFCFYS